MVSPVQKIIAIGIIVMTFALGWFSFDVKAFLNSPVYFENDDSYIFDIPQGTSLQKIASFLQERGIIKRPSVWVWFARWEGVAGKIKAGEYEIPSGITPVQLLDLLIKGDVVHYAHTIVEGWNIWQVLDSVKQDANLSHTLPDDITKLMMVIAKQDIHPEGQFFPDTYHFTKGMSDIELLRRAHLKMEVELTELWKNRKENLPLSSPYEALILASIIEKETADPSEYRKIAGVFIRRLEKGMKLQTDPTVIYGIGQKFDGNIRRKDLQTDTPYNTYVRYGLTPTPISMPGRQAIEAALNPDEGKVLYFVSKGDGTHYFSATLKEHQNAVRRYQLKK